MGENGEGEGPHVRPIESATVQYH